LRIPERRDRAVSSLTDPPFAAPAEPPAAPAAPAPVAATERAPLPDILRGFALLGILLMNIEGFVGPLAASVTGVDPSLVGLDRWVDATIYLLVQGKFYTLFSLLFGAGFALILLRAQARGSGGGWLYLRRLLVLLAIGLLHALYIWSGDILTVYALIGLILLLLFRRTPTSRLPKWAIAIYSLPLLLVFLFGLAGQLAQLDPDAAAEFDRSMQGQQIEMAELEQAQREAYGAEGSFAAANQQRRVDFAWLMGYTPIFGPTVLGMFLLGAWFVRSGALLQPERHAGLYRRLQRWGLGLGLPLALWSVWMLPNTMPDRMDFAVASASNAMLVANLLLCLGYLSTIALLIQSPRWAHRLAVLAPAGRMALTHYLLQSIVCVGIFYGYGLGYFEQLSRAWQVPFVLALFAAQVALSHWWLARYRFGPVEWLWRSLTYLRPQPMRVAP
jgi:uncharacterized protein